MSSRSILRQNIYLIGDVDTQILGNKLPSKLQVMKVFFFHTRILKSQLRESAVKTINEVKVFWQKANLPTQRDDHCIDKVLKLYGEYQALQKNKSRVNNQEKEQEFVSSLKNLFDIANVNIFEMIDEIEKMFLLNQRKDGRVGHIANIESEYDTLERENSQRDEMHQQRVKRSKQQIETLGKTILYFIN